MRQVGEFFRLAPSDRGLLIAAAFLLWFTRLGLWVFPFPTLRWCVARVASLVPRAVIAGHASTDRVVWAVTVASRYVPRASCLTQALAAQALLVHARVPAHLRIGVAKTEDGQLLSHAWIESQGRIILGEFDRERFVPIVHFQGVFSALHPELPAPGRGKIGGHPQTPALAGALHPHHPALDEGQLGDTPKPPPWQGNSRV